CVWLLVAILDADKEGFLRSERSLVQTCGRAARNAQGTVILYADKITKSMQYTIDETNRRRKIQEEFNRKHGIVPQTIISEIKNSMTEHLRASGWESDGAVADDAGMLRAAEPEMVYHSAATCIKRLKYWRSGCRKRRIIWLLKRPQPCGIRLRI
ncbi:hypothetical protein VU03_01390, partial [Desulfobulbus sp. N3]|nr:hypothetical protein [Desulfobulbus sp. N3]